MTTASALPDLGNFETCAEKDVPAGEWDKIHMNNGVCVFICIPSYRPLKFVTAEAEYVLDPLPVISGEPNRYLQIVNGKQQLFVIHEALTLTANGVDLKEAGIDAIGHCEDTGEMILLVAAINEVGGQRLVSNPVSWCRFRRHGNAKSFPVLEASVV